MFFRWGYSFNSKYLLGVAHVNTSNILLELSETDPEVYLDKNFAYLEIGNRHLFMPDYKKEPYTKYCEDLKQKSLKRLE